MYFIIKYLKYICIAYDLLFCITQKPRATILRVISNRVRYRGQQSLVYSWMKRKADILFLETVMRPILDVQREGFKLFQVGRGQAAVTVKLVPYFYCFSMDTAEARVVTGTTMGSRKCRMCERRCSDFSTAEIPIMRDALEVKTLQDMGELNWIKQMTTGLGSLTNREKQVCFYH